MFSDIHKSDKTIQLSHFWAPSIDSNDIKWFMCYILLSINNLNVLNYILKRFFRQFAVNKINNYYRYCPPVNEVHY